MCKGEQQLLSSLCTFLAIVYTVGLIGKIGSVFEDKENSNVEEEV